MSFSGYSLGLVFIGLVSVIWAAASVLVQYLYTSDNFDFDSPFLLTYIGVSLFTTLLPLQCLLDKFFDDTPDASIGDGIGGTATNATPVDVAVEEFALTTTTVTEAYQPFSSPNGSNPTSDNTTRKWTTEDHIWAAAKIAPVWFISNYSYNASLKYTSITSSTVLASTGSLFTFLFALSWKDETFTWPKLVGILLGMTGSILTGLHDVETPSDSSDNGDESIDYALWGDTLGLLSAVGYGLYAVMVRLLCPQDESLMSMQTFLGFVGLWNLVLLSPIALFQSVWMSTGVTWVVFGFLVIKGLLDNVLSDYLWARAVILTSATVATVGLGLTIPLAFASDLLLGRPDVLDGASILGALAVLAGFVLVNIGQKQEEQQHRQQGDEEDSIYRSPDSAASSARGDHEMTTASSENDLDSYGINATLPYSDVPPPPSATEKTFSADLRVV